MTSNFRCSAFSADRALVRFCRCLAWAAVLFVGVNVWVDPLLPEEVAEQPPNLREPTGKRWVDMDYGPNLTLTLEASPGNFAYKGVAIRLDEGEGGVSAGNDFVIFDTDTLRFAAGWKSPKFIDYHCIHLDGEHEVHPSAVGHRVFTNPIGPGWSRPGTDEFDDARLRGRDGRPYGPLDRQWAHWKGLYRHGHDVVLSYWVGETTVLEKPALEGSAITRALNIGPRSQDLVLQVAHQADAEIDLRPPSSGPPDAVLYAVFVPRDLQTPTPNPSPEDGGGGLGTESRGADDERESVDDDDDEPGIRLDGQTSVVVGRSADIEMTEADYTVWARIDTESGGTIFAKAPRQGPWEPDAKALFIENGHLVFDIGWVGAVRSKARVADGELHSVAITWEHASGRVRLFVDGKLDNQGTLRPNNKPPRHVAKLGFSANDFPENQPAYAGYLGEVRFYSRALSADEFQLLEDDEAGSPVTPAPPTNRGRPSEARSKRANGVDHGSLAGQPSVENGLVARWNQVGRKRTVRDALGGHHARMVAIEEDMRHGIAARVIGQPGYGPQNGTITCVGLIGGPPGCHWIRGADGHLRLKIPAGDTPTSLKLVYAQVHDPQEVEPFEELLQEVSPAADLRPLCGGGPPRWTKTITTKAKVLGRSDGPYVAEAITTPHDNPYRSWMRLSGFDFFADGRRAAVCTWQGDVWVVDGLGGDFDTFTWKRIASGMFQPLGLKIVDENIYVTCRDQITLLRDLNDDGETDFYENFNNDAQVTDHFHEFAVGLDTDEEGNFYYAKCGRHAREALVPHHGTLLKVSQDGSKTEILANGFRAPNGICVNDDGTFILSDQEGHWTPQNRINWVKPGGFYGYMMGYYEGRRRPNQFDPPVCWIHNQIDRSPAEQLWIDSKRWGPLEGYLISLSYGTGEIHLVLYEEVDGLLQGGVVRMPIPDFPTGIMRGRFNAVDGHLYSCGLFGWSSDKTAPGGFYRVRYTGKPVHLPTSLKATKDGMLIRFSQPLDVKSASDWANYAASRWQYRRTAQYGSEDYKISNRRRRGRDRVRIEEAVVSADGHSVLLKIRDMKPTMQMEIQYRIKAADGTPLSQTIHHTIHKVGPASGLEPGKR